MPVELHTLLVFVPVALALNLTPGADMMFCLAQGMRGGARVGWAASLGISTGCLVHVIVAGLGLAALVAAEPLVFEVIRWTGVAYLVWLAIQTLRHSGLSKPSVGSGSALRAWRDGMIVNLGNPKVAIFVLALIPQFVDPAAGSTFAQFLILGMVLTLGGTVINGLVGTFAGAMGRLLTRRPDVARWLDRISAAVFLGLAAKLAFDRR